MRILSTPLRACSATHYGEFHPSDSFLSKSEWPDYTEGPPACFVMIDGGLGYGHGGPGVCLGDGQTEADRVASQDGRGDALRRRT